MRCELTLYEDRLRCRCCGRVVNPRAIDIDTLPNCRAQPIAPATRVVAASNREPVRSVAVVVPCRNYGRFLATALDSIHQQSFQASQVIVIDDDSSDDTASVSVQNNGRVDYHRVCVHDPHAARRIGFDRTSADAVVFLDADDKLPPDYLQAGVDTLNAGSDVAYTRIQEFGLRRNSWLGEAINLQRWNFVHAGSMVRRSAILAARAFETPNHFAGEDWEFWRRIERHGGKFAEAPTTYLYRIHEPSRSSNRPAPAELDRIVIGCYLALAPDPQRGVAIPRDDPRLVERWASTLRDVWCDGVLLVDHDAARLRSSFPWLQIERVEAAPASTHNIAWRWRLIAEYLSRSTLRSAFITDVFDVEFRIDPLGLLTRDRQLWIGVEPVAFGDGTSSAKWMRRMFQGTYGHEPAMLNGLPVLNAGIVGGWSQPLSRLASKMWQELQHRGPAHSAASDMAALNMLVRRDWREAEIWCLGEPLHSRFKGFETHRRDVCIIHK